MISQLPYNLGIHQHSNSMHGCRGRDSVTCTLLWDRKWGELEGIHIYGVVNHKQSKRPVTWSVCVRKSWSIQWSFTSSMAWPAAIPAEEHFIFEPWISHNLQTPTCRSWGHYSCIVLKCSLCLCKVEERTGCAPTTQRLILDTLLSQVNKLFCFVCFVLFIFC